MLFLKQLISVLYGFFKSLPTIKKWLTDIYNVISDLIWKAHQKKIDNDLNKASEEAKQTKDTSNLENLFGGTKPKEITHPPKAEVHKQDAPVAAMTIAPEVPSEVEEKKKTTTHLQESNGSGIFFKVLGAAAGLTALNAVFGAKSAKAASLGSISSSVDITQINRVQLNGASRMGSKMLGLAFILFISMNASKCQTAENRPNYAPKIWAGDSQTGSVVRAQENQSIPATSREFDNYVALSYRDLACVYKTYVDNCEKFRSPIVDCSGIGGKDGQKLYDHINDHEDEFIH